MLSYMGANMLKLLKAPSLNNQTRKKTRKGKLLIFKAYLPITQMSMATYTMYAYLYPNFTYLDLLNGYHLEYFSESVDFREVNLNMVACR